MNLGITKKQILSFTQQEWEFFKNEKGILQNVDVSYIEYNHRNKTFSKRTKEEYDKSIKNKNNYSETYSIAALCDPTYTTCKGTNSSSWIKLTVSATDQSITSDFDWLTETAWNERFSDFFGSGHNSNLTLDYNSIYGVYRTEYSDSYNNWKRTVSKTLGYPYKTDSTGYAHKLDLHEEYIQNTDGTWLDATNDNGYTYARYYWNSSSATASSAYANYTHLSTSWSTSYSVGVPLSMSIGIENTDKDISAPNAAISWYR